MSKVTRRKITTEEWIEDAPENDEPESLGEEPEEPEDDDEESPPERPTRGKR